MVAYIQRTDTYETRVAAHPDMSAYPEVVSSLRGKHILVFILTLPYHFVHLFGCLVAHARLSLVAPAL